MKTSELMTNCGKTTRVWLALACLATGLALPAPAGVVLDLTYGLSGSPAIPGVNVSDLTNNALFPNSPDGYNVLTTNLFIPNNIANDYGSWVRGFIEAPQTGQYTFWLAAMDSGQLWLSPSTDPAGKVLVAQNGLIAWMAVNDWFLSPSQQSAPISLVAGQKYYFELLQKEDNDGTDDSASVAWSWPDGSFHGPISCTNLWPYPVDVTNPAYPPVTMAPQILNIYDGWPVDGLPGTAVAFDGGTADLTITAVASQPATVQWYTATTLRSPAPTC